MPANKELAIKSAQTVSALRAIANKDKDLAARCSDYLAKNFIGPKYKLVTGVIPQRLLKSTINLMFPGSYGFIITRTRLFDKILQEEINEDIRQVVILGAGYDTRAFRFAEKLKGTRIYEMDFPGTQVYKRSRIAQVFKKIPDNLIFIPIDFTAESFDQILMKNGFCLHLKTLFLWEGVSYYLPEPLVKKVLSFVSYCAAGSSILFDYATRKFINGDHSTYGGKAISKWLKKINEPFLFGMNANETCSFIKNCKLTLIADYGPEELEELYLKNRKGEKVGKTLGHVRMAHAKVLRRSLMLC